MFWLILAVFLCAIFYYKLVRPMSYWKKRGVVYKKPLPIVGNPSFVFQRQSFFDLYYNLYNQFPNERYFGTYQFTIPTLIVRDLELIKRITVKDFEHFLNHNSTISEDIEPLFSKNLFNLKGQRWRDMRATLSPSFTSSKMKMMFTLVSECAENFVKYFEGQNRKMMEVEMKDIFTRYTNDAIATVAFGFKCNSLENKTNDFYMMGKEITQVTAARFMITIFYSLIPVISKLIKFRIFSKPTMDYFNGIIKETLRKREMEGLIRPDMIHLLMEARANAKKSNSGKKRDFELSDEDITAQALIFFFGGFDTSSTLMTFAAYELALNEDIQRRLQKEIDETLIECNGTLTYDAIHKMNYMDMVVSETLRKWPPGFMLDRMCVKDYEVEPANSWEKPLTIKKGVLIQIPAVGIHRDPNYFPHPDKFDPERFNDDNKNNIEPFTYLPFGSGPRLCIASRFALMENKTLLFHLLSKFDIVKIDKTIYPMKISKKNFNIAAEGGVWLGLRRRKTE